MAPPAAPPAAPEPLELGRVLSLKPGLRVERPGNGPTFLLGERERFVAPGAAAAEVLALVDGRRTVHEIVRAASPRVPEPEALYALIRLVASGHLVTAAPDLPPERAAFWHGVGLDARAATAALARTPVSVRALGDAVPSAWLTEALEQAGVLIGPDADVLAVLTDDLLHPELAAIDDRARRRDAPWCLIKPVGVMPLVGPIFAPGVGPCWACLAFWVRQNRPVEELVRRQAARDAPASTPPALFEASARAACGLGALALARALAAAGTEAARALASQVIALDLASLQTSAHAVVKRPQCSTCGDVGLMKAVGERPIALRPVPKTDADAGGYRQQAPRLTYDRWRHLISPITGAVTHVSPMPGRDTERRAVYTSGYLLCPRDGGPHASVFDKPCAGKGRDADQARVGALAEALERYSGVYQGDEARVRASRDELGPAALPPSALLGFSAAQYDARARRHASSADRRTWVPAPLEPSTPIDWTPAWSLSRRERRYVPLTYCYAEAPAECGVAFCGPCGNGVAAGTCLEEALLQALLELCERDAVGIWWYNRVTRPALDLDNFGDPYVDALRADYARLGWSLWALDLTHDLRLPTCAALAHHAPSDRFAIGFGCHLTPRLAAQRALTELNQIFDPEGTRKAPWGQAQLASRDYLFPCPDRPPIAAQGPPWATGAGWRASQSPPWAAGAGWRAAQSPPWATGADVRAAQGHPSPASADLRADLEHCIHRLDEAGLELIVVDKTRPDLGVHVIQAIVPGLRHFWPRFGPGRLYDVPPALGWLPRPLGEGELNPVPLLL
ncbi:MAG: TOMM precursor leader peptide-binding protein [Polyangiaceae bacterium]|nr:TOMM precursor leader peptide-binding protein [Polyangiaceae bacterium]